MKFLKPIFTFLLLFGVSGCSTVQYFMVRNCSSSGIAVSYQLTETNGIPIFNDKYSVYSLTSSNEIDWNAQKVIADLDTSLAGVKVIMPAKSALIFGSLHNDNYTAYNQKFINRGAFNLKEIGVSKNHNETKVLPMTFDTHFKNVNGNIRMDIK